MEIDEIEDKFDELEGKVEDNKTDINGCIEAIGVLAKAILEQQKQGPIPPVIIALLEKYSKWGTDQ